MECVGHGEVKNLEDKPAKKMFIQIVKQLHDLIEEQNIQEGQKLPSERMLSEQLQVGRSSVREALRSLELLGFDRNKAWRWYIFVKYATPSVC